MYRYPESFVMAPVEKGNAVLKDKQFAANSATVQLIHHRSQRAQGDIELKFSPRQIPICPSNKLHSCFPELGIIVKDGLLDNETAIFLIAPYITRPVLRQIWSITISDYMPSGYNVRNELNGKDDRSRAYSGQHEYLASPVTV